MDGSQHIDDAETPKNGPATTAVIDTAELLLEILLRLNFTTLLLAQRVDRRFQQIITSSSSLQKKLFLSPATLEKTGSLCMIEDNTMVCMEGDWNSLDDDFMIVNSHVLVVTGKRDQEEDLRTRSSLSPKILADTISARRGRSSWERMYVSQPPCNQLRVSFDFSKSPPEGIDPIGVHAKRLSPDPTFYTDFYPGRLARFRDIMDGFEVTLLEHRGYAAIWTQPYFVLGWRLFDFEEWLELLAEISEDDEVDETTEEDEPTEDGSSDAEAARGDGE